MSDFEFAPGMRVEWRNGSGGDISHGTLVEPDNGLGGPWWLVDVDGEGKNYLVKTWALRPEEAVTAETELDRLRKVEQEVTNLAAEWERFGLQGAAQRLRHILGEVES